MLGWFFFSEYKPPIDLKSLYFVNHKTRGRLTSSYKYNNTGQAPEKTELLLDQVGDPMSRYTAFLIIHSRNITKNITHGVPLLRIPRFSFFFFFFIEF